MRSAESREVADEAAVVRGQAARRKCVKDWRKKRDKRRKAAEEPMGEEPAPPTPTPTPTDAVAATVAAALTSTLSWWGCVVQRGPEFLNGASVVLDRSSQCYTRDETRV